MAEVAGVGIRPAGLTIFGAHTTKQLETNFPAADLHLDVRSADAWDREQLGDGGGS